MTAKLPAPPNRRVVIWLQIVGAVASIVYVLWWLLT